MANYIITRSKENFEKIGNFNYCELDEMILPDTISVDSETTGLEAHLSDYMFSVQIGTGKNNYIIDLEHRDTPLLQGNQIYFKELIPYLENKTLIFHNADFDLRFFYKEGFYPETVRDTMIASKCLYNGVDGIYSHSFDKVMEREMGLKYNKDEQKSINKVRLTTKRNIEYSFDDVDKLLELESILFQKLVNEDAFENYLFQCKFVLAQAFMENCGLQISSALWRQKSDNDLVELKKSQNKIKEYIYDNLPKFRVMQLDLFGDNRNIICNLDSPKQMIPVFKEFGINTWDEREEKDSISEGIINKSKHEFVDMWLEYQGHNHNVSTFGYSLLDKIHNERIYSTFNILAETGRMLSRKGSINFLNFPSNKETRSCFKSVKGWKSVGCDYDSQEAKILAWDSQDENAKLNVIHNRDTHSLLARQIFEELKDLSDREIKTQHNDKRQLGKVAGLKKNYIIYFVFAY